MSGSGEIGVFPRNLFRIHSQFLDLLGMRCIKNLRMVGFEREAKNAAGRSIFYLTLC